MFIAQYRNVKITLRVIVDVADLKFVWFSLNNINSIIKIRRALYNVDLVQLHVYLKALSSPKSSTKLSVVGFLISSRIEELRSHNFTTYIIGSVLICLCQLINTISNFIMSPSIY